jgi:hypothetical protein
MSDEPAFELGDELRALLQLGHELGNVVCHRNGLRQAFLFATSGREVTLQRPKLSASTTSAQPRQAIEETESVETPAALEYYLRHHHDLAKWIDGLLVIQDLDDDRLSTMCGSAAESIVATLADLFENLKRMSPKCKLDSWTSLVAGQVSHLTICFQHFSSNTAAEGVMVQFRLGNAPTIVGALIDTLTVRGFRQTRPNIKRLSLVQLVST